MELIEIVRAHLAAWQTGDASAVADSVASFSDPDTEEPIAGDALLAHAEQVLARFAGLRIEIEQLVPSAEVVLVSWRLTADHRSSYLGMPATGGAVAVRGTDVVTADADGAHVVRTFDRLAVAAALGFEARFTPAADGDREFGVSSRTSVGRTTPPGVLALTWLEIRDDAEAADVDLLSVEVVKSLRASQGFLGASTFDIGRRKFTLTAFDRAESVRAVHARPHQRAMRRFFKSGLCTRALTSIWEPTAIREYARCPECDSVVTMHGVEPGAAACDCGWAPEPEPLL
ncbi:SnoaL-like polyketide cyclase [Actinoalloteichus sp. GBA129-24]|uniref:SnoaL-like polyketide cyclase n=1 Tax=Actinoalloteichus fjordicus TaxID=1612552 RepID=A0AAC9L8P4_9PSEU|nr:SnoaL-like polyketide cyclase [Actinoalloteichus fjordicus]APU19179.1 SnoaL-like polyketide cyclase [Actinoalloteichus sp. GBA129-24]